MTEEVKRELKPEAKPEAKPEPKPEPDPRTCRVGKTAALPSQVKRG
jgi:hypothetical protein